MTNRPLRALIVVALLIGIGLLIAMAATVLSRFENIITAIVLAILFAYVIYPGVRMLSRRMPRALAVLVVYLVAFIVIGFAAAYLAPTIGFEAVDLSRRLPAILIAVEAQAAHPEASPWLGHLSPQIRALLVANAARAETIVSAFADTVGARAFDMLRGTVTLVVDAIIVLTVAFFLITDVERVRATAFRLVPRAARQTTEQLVTEVDRVLSGFVRGQVLLALIIGIAVTVILLSTGVPYAILLGALAGLATVIPIVGEFIGGIPVCLVTLVTAGPLKALIVLVLFLFVFEVQGRVLAPIIVGKSVGVSPLVIFVAILLGAEAFGVLGMVLAVPIAGILRVALDRFAPADEPGTVTPLHLAPNPAPVPAPAPVGQLP
jgi:predicted PurR-regulated permease PerM